MKTIIFAVILSLLQIPVFSQNKAADEIKNIKVELKSESDMNNAMEEIRASDPVFYKTLEKLKKDNAPDFKSRLENAYYVLKHKQTLDKTIPKRELGYRELIKKSDIKFAALKTDYKNTKTDSDKDKVKSEISKAAEERFNIELNRKKKRLDSLAKLIDNEKKIVREFEDGKQKYIERTVVKTTSSVKP